MFLIFGVSQKFDAMRNLKLSEYILVHHIYRVKTTYRQYSCTLPLIVYSVFRSNI